MSRWLTARDKPGCLFLYGERNPTPDRLSPEERAHELYAESICSEVEVDDGQQRKWITQGKKNDYFDASWHSDCAAAMRGIRILAAKDSSTGKQRMTLRQYAEMAGNK